MAATRTFAITGGPGAGKSSLLEELGRRGVATMPEVARIILREAGGMELRANDPLGFAEAMLEAQIRRWEEARAAGGVAVFDRGFPDICGFLQVEGLPVSPAIDRACRSFRFAEPVFRAPPWDAIYRPDEERIQTWEEAVASDRAVTAAWRDYGYTVLDLPMTGVERRADVLLRRISAG